MRIEGGLDVARLDSQHLLIVVRELRGATGFSESEGTVWAQCVGVTAVVRLSPDGHLLSIDMPPSVSQDLRERLGGLLVAQAVGLDSNLPRWQTTETDPNGTWIADYERRENAVVLKRRRFAGESGITVQSSIEIQPGSLWFDAYRSVEDWSLGEGDAPFLLHTEYTLVRTGTAPLNREVPDISTYTPVVLLNGTDGPSQAAPVSETSSNLIASLQAAKEKGEDNRRLGALRIKLQQRLRQHPAETATLVEQLLSGGTDPMVSSHLACALEQVGASNAIFRLLESGTSRDIRIQALHASPATNDTPRLLRDIQAISMAASAAGDFEIADAAWSAWTERARVDEIARSHLLQAVRSRLGDYTGESPNDIVMMLRGSRRAGIGHDEVVRGAAGDAFVQHSEEGVRAAAVPLLADADDDFACRAALQPGAVGAAAIEWMAEREPAEATQLLKRVIADPATDPGVLRHAETRLQSLPDGTGRDPDAQNDK